MNKIEAARIANPIALSFVRIELENEYRCGRAVSDHYRLGKYLPDGRRCGWFSAQTWKDRAEALRVAELYNGPEANRALHD